MTLASADQPIERTTSEQIQFDQSGAVRCTRFNDFYFNPGCGAEETRHVFLQGNRLEQRWREAADSLAAPTQRRGKLAATTFCIGETGFGTGLNFLATLDLWLAIHRDLPPQVQPALVYYATEKYPLTRTALEKVLQHYNPYPELSGQLLEQYPDAIGGDYLLQFNLYGCRAKLLLLFGDSVDALNRLEHYPRITQQGRARDSPAATQIIDAWFLDGFAPAQNPAMWRTELFATIGRHSRAGTSAATFSVARVVRDGLAAAGFTSNKSSGFGRKREMLAAQWSQTPKQAPEQTPATRQGTAPSRKEYSLANCYRRAEPQCLPAQTAKSAVVIGAGIAGCCTAHKLAARGWQVKVIDQHGTAAGGASGNRAAILHARTAQQRAILADFYEASFHYAAGFYRCLPNSPQRGLRGMLMLDQQLDPQWLTDNPESCSRKNVSAKQASALAHIPLHKQGIFYPTSGYLEPAVVCRQLLDAANIEFIGAQSIDTLSRDNELWHLAGSNGYHAQTDVVIVACGTGSRKFEPCAWLPLKSLRGQTTDLPAIPALANLAVSLCEQGYCTPALDDGKTECHSVGATYNLDYNGLELRECDHQENIHKLGQMLNWNSLPAEAGRSLGGRASLRCISPDYLPMVGSVVEPGAFIQRFSGLQSNARQTPLCAAPALPGLFINTAYGSQGYTMAPLAAEILLAEITGEPFPIGDRLRQALSPTRFLVRQLIKSKSATTAININEGV